MLQAQSMSACARLPAISCFQSRLSNGMDAFISCMIAAGPWPNRPPHMLLESDMRFSSGRIRISRFPRAWAAFRNPSNSRPCPLKPWTLAFRLPPRSDDRPVQTCIEQARSCPPAVPTACPTSRPLFRLPIKRSPRTNCLEPTATPRW